MADLLITLALLVLLVTALWTVVIGINHIMDIQTGRVARRKRGDDRG